MLKSNKTNSARRIPTNTDRYYIVHNMYYNIRLVTRKTSAFKSALIKDCNTGYIRCKSVERRIIPTSANKIFMHYAKIGANASIKAKRLKDVQWISELNDSDIYDSQIESVSKEDLINESYIAILNYSKLEYTNIVRIAMRGGNNYLTGLQRKIASNSALDERNTKQEQLELTERQKARRKYISQSKPAAVEQSLIKAEKLEYIFSHMSKEEVKLFKVWSEELRRTKDKKTGKCTTARVNLGLIRTRMNYDESESRMTTSRKLKATISKVKNLMKEYDTISKNLIPNTDNENVINNIKLNASITAYARKKAEKVVFNLNGLNKVHTNSMDSYKNVADHSNSYYIPTKNISFDEYQAKLVESERIRRNEYIMRLRHSRADIRSLNDIREKRIAHIRNMHNPLTK